VSHFTYLLNQSLNIFLVETADDREQLYKTLAEKESALAALLKEKATLQSVWVRSTLHIPTLLSF
jgi:hypothetical protein